MGVLFGNSGSPNATPTPGVLGNINYHLATWTPPPPPKASDEEILAGLQSGLGNAAPHMPTQEQLSHLQPGTSPNYQNPFTSPTVWHALASNANNLVHQYLPGVTQAADVGEALTGVRQFKENTIDTLERSGKLSHDQANAARQQILDQYKWVGNTDANGKTNYNLTPGENAKKAAGEALQLTSEVVPMPVGKVAEGASLPLRIGKGALQGATAGAAHATGSGLVEKGSVNPLDVAKGAGEGAAFAGGLTAAGGLAGRAAGRMADRINAKAAPKAAAEPSGPAPLEFKSDASGKMVLSPARPAETPAALPAKTGEPAPLSLTKLKAKAVEPTTASLAVEKPTETTISSLKPTTPKAAAEPTVEPVSGVAKIGEPAKAGDAGSLVDRFKAKMSDAYAKTIDRYNPLVKLGKAAGARDTVENALAGHYGAGSTAEYHTQFELKPILEGANAHDLRDYLIASRDEELGNRGIKGSDVETAQRVLSDLHNRVGDQAFADLRQRAMKLYDYQKNMVNQYMVKTGMMSKTAADAMFENNKAYVPFKRIMDKVDEHLGVTPGNKVIATSQNIIKGIKGSDRKIIDPIQSMIENTYKMVALGRQNEVGRVLADLAPKLGEDVIKPISAKAATGKATISVFENGRKKLFQVAPEVAEAAKALNGDQMNALAKILSAPTRLFRETATGANPEFAIPNLARDLQTAFVNAGLNPMKWVAGLAHYLKKDDVYQQFLKAGGQTSRLSLDHPSLQRTVGELTGERGISVANPKRLYHLFQRIGEASEVPTRLAVFQKALKQQAKQQGIAPDVAERAAARAAQEVTTNFARRGSATKSINAAVAFLNARAQGTDRLLRSFKANPAGVGLRLGLTTLAPALTLYAYNRQFPAYNDPRIVSQTDKDNNFIIMAPWLGENRYIKIPKGDVGRIANPIEAFLSYADGKGGDVANELGQALSAFSPAQNLGDALPTMLKPPIEVALNKNFFTGQQIVPDYKKNYPASEQFTSSTPGLYRWLGGALNLSPAQIQDIAQGYLTGYARMGESATNPILPKDQQPNNKTGADVVNNVPILRRFVGGAKQSPQEYATSLSKQINSIDFSKKDLKAGLNRGDISKAQYDKQFQQLDQQQKQIKQQAQQNGYGDLLQRITYQANAQRAQKAAASRSKGSGIFYPNKKR